MHANRSNRSDKKRSSNSKATTALRKQARVNKYGSTLRASYAASAR